MTAGLKVTTHRVRWKVRDREWRQGFRSAAQADNFWSALLTAAKRCSGAAGDRVLDSRWR